MNTLGYEERGPESEASSPELIALGESPVGRETLAAIAEDLVGAARPEKPAAAANPRTGGRPQAERSDVFEVSTFVVRDGSLLSERSDEARRQYVRRRLLHRLPVLSMQEVERIDLTAAEEAHTWVLRIWCRVPER